MITVYVGEQRGGIITIVSNRDCLPADVIRTSTRVFADYDSVLDTAEMYWRRGFQVYVDTEQGSADYEH